MITWMDERDSHCSCRLSRESKATVPTCALNSSGNKVMMSLAYGINIVVANLTHTEFAVPK